MAKTPHKQFYSVGDIVIINKKPWKITKIYHAEHRYRVIPMFEVPNPAWNEMFPDHNDITGIMEEY